MAEELTEKEKTLKEKTLKERVFTNNQRNLFNLQCRHEDESLIYDILTILGNNDLSVDRASRVLTDAQTMLPILAKIPKTI